MGPGPPPGHSFHQVPSAFLLSDRSDNSRNLLPALPLLQVAASQRNGRKLHVHVQQPGSFWTTESFPEMHGELILSTSDYQNYSYALKMDLVWKQN